MYKTSNLAIIVTHISKTYLYKNLKLFIQGEQEKSNK